MTALSAADLQMKLEGAPDPFPATPESPAKPRKARSQATEIDVASEDAFPSLATTGAPAKPAGQAWGAGPTHRIKAAAQTPMISESFTLTVMDLSTAGKDGRPTTLGEIMRQVMAKHKVKVEASTNQRTHQTTFAIKSESQKELDKGKRVLLALLSPVVTLVVNAPASTIPSIIGVKGANLNLIRDQTGVKIDIPRRDHLTLGANGSVSASASGTATPVPAGDDDEEQEPTIPVSITGPRSAAYEAQEMINRHVVAKRSKSTQRVRDIPAHVLPFVKARKGAFEAVAQGRELSLALNAPEREITVVGDRDAVVAVVEAIRSTIDSITGSITSVKMSLPKRQHRLLTGKNADEVLTQTKCAIVIPGEDELGEEITVWGRGEDLGNGLQAVMTKANSQYIHEFPLPGPIALSRQIATYMTRIQHAKQLEAAHPGVHVYTPSPAVALNATSLSIDLVGDKPAVDGAVRQVSELIGKLIGAVRGLEIDWLIHRILQGAKNGKKIKQFHEANNVSVFFPPETAEQSSVLLVYDPASPNASSNPVEKGKQLDEVAAEVMKMAREAADVKSETITVDPKWHSAIVGENGTTLNAIIGEEKTLSIKFGKEAGGDALDAVVIRGQSTEVDRAVKKIHEIVEDAKNELIASSYSTEFDIDRDYVSRIVGTGGAGANKLRTSLGVKIDFADGNDDKDKFVDKSGKNKKPSGQKTHVTITGRKENAEEAKKRILAQVDRMADETSETLKIPVQYHAALIGQGGKWAIRLEEKYAVKITFPRHGENGDARTREVLKADDVLIKGGKKGVAGAKSELLELLEFEKENKAETKFTVPRRSVARILGRSGASINEIKESTDTQIDIDKGESETAHITIHGNKKNIAEAKALILEIAESVQEEKSDTVNIETKFHRTLIGAGGQGLREIIMRAGGPEDPRLHVGLVRFPRQGDSADEVRLRGEPKLVAKLKTELEKEAAKLRDRVVIGVEIPGAHHRALIGRGGQHLNELQQRTDTQVQFPGSRSYNAVGEMINADELGDVDPANIVKVSGPKAGCEKAIQDLKAASARENKPARAPKVSRPASGAEVTGTVTVPVKYHHAISQGGSFFRSLRSSGVTVDHSVLPQKPNVPPQQPVEGGAPVARIDDVDDSAGADIKWQIVPNYQDAEEGDSEWTIRARDAEGLERAQQRVQDAIAHAEKMSHVGFLTGIDKSVFPRIVGTKGATIQRLRDETGADITVGREDPIITIIGSTSALEHAKDEITKMAAPRPSGGRGRGRRED